MSEEGELVLGKEKTMTASIETLTRPTSIDDMAARAQPRHVWYHICDLLLHLDGWIYMTDSFERLWNPDIEPFSIDQQVKSFPRASDVELARVIQN